MPVKNLHHLKYVPAELLREKNLSRFALGRLALLRGELSLPTFSAEEFDGLLARFHLSYTSLASLIGVSEQRLLRYRKKGAFPASVALLLRILQNEQSHFFSHYCGTSANGFKTEGEFISQITNESAIESRLSEIDLGGVLKTSSHGTINEKKSISGSVQIIPIRLGSDR